MCSDFTRACRLSKRQLSRSCDRTHETSATVSRPSNLLAAWLVHVYTAPAPSLAFAGTVAVFTAAIATAFSAMVAATVVDATDGVLARLRPGQGGARPASTAPASTISSTT